MIPESVTSIGNAAFIGCTGLIAIEVDALNPAYASLDGVLLNKSLDKLVAYPGGKAGSYIIPDSVTSIGPYAFAECAGLTGVTIPDSVTSIGETAFYLCRSLTNVTIGDSVTSIGEWAFADCSSLTSIYFNGDAPTLDSRYGMHVFDRTPATVYYFQGTLGWGPTFGGCPTVAIVLDSDGDGIPDSEDSCPLSDLRATVVIGGRNSGVPNTWFPDGATIADHVGIIAVAARNHGGFVNGVAEYLDELKEAGVITGAQKGAIQSCAAKAKIP